LYWFPLLAVLALLAGMGLGEIRRMFRMQPAPAESPSAPTSSGWGPILEEARQQARRVAAQEVERYASRQAAEAEKAKAAKSANQARASSPSTNGALVASSQVCEREKKQVSLLAESNLHLSRTVESALLGRQGTGDGMADQVSLRGGVLFSDPEALSGAPRLKFPPAPFKWQKQSPCNTAAYEQSINGGCWIEVGVAPCRDDSFERAGKCYLAVIAKRAPPPQPQPQPQPPPQPPPQSEDREAH
jgi:hypothetical protein